MKRPVLAAAFFFAVIPAFAEGSEPVVFEARNAEASIHGAPWRPLEPRAALPAGTRVRTGANGTLVLAYGEALERVVALGEDTRARLQSAGARLEEGRIFVLVDSHEDAGPSLGVRAGSLGAEIASGGFQMDASGRETVVRVFGGIVRAEGGDRPVEVREGYKLRAGARGPARLVYEDYQDWQSWIRKLYEKKDDVYQDRAEKELVR